MATETLANLRTRIRQRTDNEHTGEDFVTDAELNQLINKSYRELYALLVKAGLHSVPETSYSIPITGATSYALPDDFYAIQDVFRTDGAWRTRLRRHGARTRPNATTVGDAYSYRTSGVGTGAVIELYPTPSAGTYTMYYVAIPAVLALDADLVDGVLGWEEYIVLDVSIDVLQKEGLKTDELQLRKAQMFTRISEESSLRDLHDSVEIADVRGCGGIMDEYGCLPGGYRGVRGWWGGLP